MKGKSLFEKDVAIKMKNKLKLWYDNSADNWNEALPTGNGRLGGMVFGNVYSERIQLNEDSLWSGGFRDRNNPSAKENLQELRKLIAKGKLKEAEDLATFAITGLPESQRHYEPLGDLFLFFDNDRGTVTNYKRELDLETGIISIKYNLDGVNYSREIFTSYPDQAMVIRITADKPNSISFHTQLARGVGLINYGPIKDMKIRYLSGFNAYVDRSCATSENSTIMAGKTGSKNGIEFCCGIKVINCGGEIKALGNTLVVKESNEVIIILSAKTSFREENPEETVTSNLNSLEKISYIKLKESYLEDYQGLFNRVEISLDESGYNNELIPTNIRLENFKKNSNDIGLLNLFFQYGRYLLIACSRPNSLPANLQGIWNQEMLPPWGSKYTININTQMNYWPAELCNLSECHLPLFDHLERMLPNGKASAEEMYGCKGFMAHHNTDIWGDTAPQDGCLSATYWPMGGAWLSLHIIEHYNFTKDKSFIVDKLYIVEEAALFLTDFLIDNGRGQLITSPTISPENEYMLPNGESGVLCEGASMDNQIIRELFGGLLKIYQELGIDSLLKEKIIHMLPKIPESKIGKYGQIMEWVNDYDECDPGHRHISQLFALHPGSQITPSKTPDLTEAAKNTLKRRLANGGGHTGWSKAWIINLWARLGDGETAYQNIVELLQNSVLPNLFDNHPPFQIDGNFGGTAGIAEMLLQSHEDCVKLLPAMPKNWKNGYVKGLRARGNYFVNIYWENSTMTNCEILAMEDSKLTVGYNNNERIVVLKAGEKVVFDKSLNTVNSL